MKYDDIFDFAIKQVQQVWVNVARSALEDRTIIAFRNDEWDLDTGRSNKQDKRVFWGVA